MLQCFTLLVKRCLCQSSIKNYCTVGYCTVVTIAVRLLANCYKLTHVPFSFRLLYFTNSTVAIGSICFAT